MNGFPAKLGFLDLDGRSIPFLDVLMVFIGFDCHGFCPSRSSSGGCRRGYLCVLEGGRTQAKTAPPPGQEAALIFLIMSGDLDQGRKTSELSEYIAPEALEVSG